MPDSTLLTREELYEMVWAEPISRIARRLGVSDVALAKVCRKLNIPRPPRGYWARLEHGYLVERRSLPQSDDETAREYLLQPQTNRRIGSGNQNDRLEVPIPRTAPRTHTVLVPIRAELNKRRRDSYGRVGTPERGIHVTPQTVPRAVRVLTILFNFLEKRGHEISINDEQLQISVAGESMHIAAFEPTKRSLIGVSDYGYHRYDYRPTGVLKLALTVPNMYGLKREWADRKNKPIEQRLGEIAGYIESAPALIEAQRREDELRRKRWERECLVRQRKNNIVRFTHERAGTIDGLAENLRRANEIRALVAEISRHPDAPVSSKRLARWAAKYADHLDPVRDFRIPGLDAKPNPYY